MASKRILTLRNSCSLFALGAASAILTGGPAHAFDANSLPQGGNVTGGSATIATSGNTLTVNQASNRAVIDWRSFDIGANAQANFNQPGASAIAVNRVNASTDPSRIEGGLHANGQVWILNPNGVMFGKSARVDAAGVVATTAHIDDKAFMAGDNRLQMRGGDSGQVVNEGHITVGEGGMAAFVAPSVRNSGTIRARVGRVTLAAGDTYTLDLAGDRLVEIGLGSGKAVVDQSGKIVNEGGVIAISAKAAGQAVDSLINMSGVIDASSVKTAGGRIVLGADTITVASNASLKADGTGGGQITAVADKTGNYAGSFSAQGSQGDGGQIETSGKTVHIDSKIAVNTGAPKGKTGIWTLDPNNMTVTAGGGGTIGSGVNDDAQSTVGADTVVAALASTNVTLQAKNTITVASAIDASGNGVAHNLTLADQDGGGLTVNLNAAITLKGAGVLSGGGTIVNVGANGLIQNGIDVALAGGAIVNVAAGVYAPNVSINKSGLSLIGASGATINVNPGTGQLNAINILGNADHVTVSGFTIVGEITGSYVNYAFGSGISRGVAVAQGATNFAVTGNNITNIRNGILVDGRNTGSVTNNFIDNTKSAISIQYSNGSEFGRAIAITGNRQGTAGNEWGLIYHLNQHLVDANTVVNNVAGTASSAVQAALLGASNANNGLSVMDRAYTLSNRTQVVVDASASLSNIDGSPRSPLTTIQAGIDAIVAGGTVNLKDGSYVITAANGYNNGYLGIAKSLKLVGQSEGGVIIDARNASTYGIRVLGGTDHVSLSNFTLLGVAAANAYGIKVEDSTNFSIDHVTSKGAYKAQLDLNGVRGGTVNFVTADGTPNGVGAGSTKGAAIAITDSQNLTVSNSTVIGGAYGGIGIYQSNKPSGYTYQTRNVTIDGSNSFNANGAAHYNYVYTEDESGSNNFGTLTIAGFDFVAGQDSNPADTFKYFQRTQQGAIDYLDSIGTVNAGYVEGWTGSAANNRFSVASATGGNAMAINPALAAAAGGATITVAPGVYAETLNITKNVDITGAGIGQTIIRPTTLLSTGVAHKYDADVKVTIFVNGASNVNLSGLTIDGNNLGNNAVVFWNNASGSIRNSRIVNPQTFNGAQTGQDLAVDATGSTTSTLTVFGVQFASWNKNAIDVVTGGGSISGGGNVTLNVSDSSFAGRGATGLNEQNGILLWERGGSSSTIKATVDHSTFSDIAYTGTDSNATGILLYGAKTGSLTVKNSTFAGSVQKYVGTDGGSLVEVDATTGNIFDGVAQGGATLDQIFNIENRLLDGTDNVGNSLVRLKAGQVYVTAAKNSVQNGVSAAAVGDTVNVQAGTYVISSGYINIDKALNLVGQNQGQVIVDARNASTYGLRVTASNGPVSISNLTLYGVTANGGYGLKAEATHGLTLANITSQGAAKSEFDLNGVIGATLTNLTANGASVATGLATNGNGVSLTDSQNIVLTNMTTRNDLWGGLALYQSNSPTGYTTQMDNITVDGTNTFTEANGIYAQDQSSLHDFGSINLAGQGIVYVAKANVGGTEGAYTWFQKTRQGAIDLAAAAPVAATVQGYAGNSVAGDNIFSVGIGINGTALSVNAALGQSLAGGVIQVADGTYAENVVLSTARTIDFGAVSLSSLTLNPAAAGAVLSGHVAAGNVTLKGAVVLGGDLSLNATGVVTLASVDGAHDLAIVAADTSLGNLGSVTRLGAVSVSGNTTLTGSSYKAGSFALDTTVLASDTTLDATGAITLASVDGAQDLAIVATDTSLGNVGNSNRLGAVSVSGDITLIGSIYKAGSIDLGAAVLASDTTLDTTGTVTLASVDGAHDLTIVAADTSLGNLGSATRLGAVSVSGGTTLTGSSYKAASIALGATALASDTTLDANGAVTLVSLDGAHDLTIVAADTSLGNLGSATRLGAVSVSGDTTLTGSSYKAGSIDLGATVLASDTTLDIDGAVTLASVDGAHDLTLVATDTSLGNLGDATRLGAVSVLGDTTLTGSSYKAGSFALGATTLTAAITTLDTAFSASAAGNIVFSGDIFGIKDGGQSLVLAAGPGTGAKSANGDLTLKDVGTTSVRLGDLKISGDDFLALTVDIAGGFTSHLTGNQVFAADTLNAGGAVNTNAVGDVSGHIVAAGNVSLSSGGAVSGSISGNALTLNSASVANASLKGNSLDATVSGNFSAAVATTGNVNTNVTGNVSGQIASGGNVSLNAGGGVSGTISGNALTLNSGSVSGATLQGSSLNATVAGNFEAAVATTGNVTTKVAGNLSGQIASGGNVSLNAGGGVSGNISGNALTLNSGSVSGATLQGNSLNATVAGNFNAAVVTTGNVSTNVTGNVSGQIASGGNVSLTAGGQVSGNIKGDALTVNSSSVGGGATLAGNTVVASVSGSFDAAVNTSGSASVSGNSISGSFTGSTVSLSGQSVSGQVNAGTLNVKAQDGAVTGNFTPGEVSSSVPLNGGVVGTNPNNYLPQQLVVEGFVLPPGTQIAANGQLILPPGTVIGLLSPGGGTPRVTMVQNVQQLGELLEAGYTAIVIDLNGRKKTARLAAN